MREMKDSGIDWIGAIPTTWEVYKHKHFLLDMYSGGTPTSSNPSFYDNEKGTPFVSIADMSKCQYVYKTKVGVSYAGIADKNLIIQPCGTILYSIYATVGAVAELKIDATISQAILSLKQKDTICEKRFYKYNLIAMKDYVFFETNGNTQFNLNAEKVRNFYFVIPPLTEQHCIADFLDQQCKKIDEIIVDIQSQIDTLEDYKKSVISEVVTKGLDPDTTMKDSGVSHIDSIPFHWKTLKLKYASTLKGRIGWQGLRTEEYRDEGPYLVTGTDFNKGYINWSSCVHISKERFEQDKNIQIQENDLLITKDGTIGKIAMAKECPAEVSLNSGVFIVRNNRKYRYIDKFFYYIILSKQFSLWFELAQHGNSTIKHLTQENFYEFTFAYPPIAEQAQIVDFLDDKCAKLDSIIEDKKAQLETIENYKKSLIYEYVTGKKEVPENE